jgi:hypothetical protein
MSDSTGKIVFSTFFNGVVHAVLPAIALFAYSKTHTNPNIQSLEAFIYILVFISVISFFMNWASFSIIQSLVCGSVFQAGHLASLAGFGVLFSVIFFSLSWHVPFIGNIIRDMLIGPQNPQQNQNENQNQNQNEVIEHETVKQRGGGDSLFVESAVHAFYMFWAGMYSIASLASFATACPAPPVA